MSQVVLDEVSISYGGPEPVVENLSLSIAEGVFYAMVGPSGSGKSSILRAIGGFLSPTTGAIRLDGRDVTNVKPERRNLGIVFQDYALFPHMTVEANVGFGLRMRRMKGARARTQVMETLELVGLPGLKDRFPDQLSGGQQQRVALARALVTQPCALLLDEPLSALDRKIRFEMQLELRRIQKETGITAIIVTHDQQEALSLGDELMVLKDGAIQQVGKPAEVYDYPANPFVASFLGDINSFSGNVSKVRQGEIETNGSAVTGVAIPEGCGPGDPVTFGVRPERWRVDSGNDSRSATTAGIGFEATVLTRLLNGQTADCELTSDLGRVILSVLSPHAAELVPGRKVTLAAAPEDIHVFAAAVKAEEISK